LCITHSFGAHSMEGIKPHIYSRFDGDLGRFFQLVLDIGQLACEQVELSAVAMARCEVVPARKVQHNFRLFRELNMDTLEANAQLLAMHTPVAGDLRFMMMLSRTAYDLERINQEALRLAELTEAYYEHPGIQVDSEMFVDIERIAEKAFHMLQSALQAVSESSVKLAIGVIHQQKSMERLFQDALRYLATYMLQDPRNIQYAIDATIGLKSMERVADHSINIGKNLIYSCTGKDVRHMNIACLDIK
jgi:phosphate transport system protein